MQYLSLPELENQATAHEAAVLATPGILPFCSGLDWQLAAHRHLYAPREAFAIRQEETWQLWAVGRLYQFQTVLQPWEADWFFGSPLAGAEPKRATRILLDTILPLAREFPLIWLGGLVVPSLPHTLVVVNFRQYFRLYTLPGCDCQLTSLEGGWEGFLGRRSAKFRTNLRRVRKTAQEAGVETAVVKATGESPGRLLQRVMEVEARSWKEEQGESIFSQVRFQRFYGYLIERLLARGRFRAVFIRHEGKDIGYAMGGVLGGHYRGFQKSYDRDFAHLSPGNLAQAALIEALAGEGLSSYDLGMVMDYKRAWADREIKLSNLLLLRK